MKKRWSLAAFMILAGLVAVSLALSPSAALAKEFKYAGPPAFTVTYPDTWTQAAENPNKVLIRLQKEGGLPTTEIQCTDNPKGVTVEKLGTWQKERYKRMYQTDVFIDSEKQATLKDGTPCNELMITWVYGGFLNLQTVLVSAVKDGKIIYVSTSTDPGKPDWTAARSLTFTK